MNKVSVFDDQIGTYLRKYRLALGMRQKGVADELGVSQQTVSGIELGRIEPSFSMVARMMRVYHSEIILGFLEGPVIEVMPKNSARFYGCSPLDRGEGF